MFPSQFYCMNDLRLKVSGPLSPTALDPYCLCCSGAGVGGILAVADCNGHNNSMLVMQKPTTNPF